MRSEITKEEIRKKLRYENGKLYWTVSNLNRKIGDEAGSMWTNKEDPRWRVRINNAVRPRSRLVWILHNGSIPDGMVVDHINRDSLDDRIENLRICTVAQNQKNRKATKAKKSGLPKGVRLDKRSNRFQAVIRFERKAYCLGMFGTAEEAKAAYDKKAVELFGEFHCES